MKYFTMVCFSFLCSVLISVELPPEKTAVFPAGMNGIALFRIPGIVVTNAGTILAYCEARKNSGADWGEIEVNLRRSTDGGKTWGSVQPIAHRGERIEGNPHKKDSGAKEQTVNNPVAIVDRETKAIEFLYCVNYARAFSIRSTDDGLSWSDPVEITATFDAFRTQVDWKVIATGPGHGIQLKNGRLVVPVWLAYGKVGAHSPSVAGTIFSDDHGKTWHAGAIAVPNDGMFNNPNESMITELSDERVLFIARNASPPNRKIVTTSTDGLSNWAKPIFHPDLWEPVCMSSLISHPAQPGVVLFSCPHRIGVDKTGSEIPNSRGKREGLAIKLSRDDGKTWPVIKELEAGPSAYSDLAVLPDGNVLCLYEGNKHILVARFTLEWLTE